MAWVRYDDNFYSNPKVTAVVAEDPGALALHLLANTWTNGQKMPGFVPAHQPAVLLCDRTLGVKWAGVLAHSGLWHVRHSLCDECAEEYAHVPAPAEGFVFHNAKEYRAPARDRLTVGTPADLSEKRREAGRKGGRVSAERRKQDTTKQEQAKQASASTGQANAKQGGSRSRAGQQGSADQQVIAGSATPGAAETKECRQASASSKASNLPLAGVSPEPVPVPTTEHPSDVLFDAPPPASPAKTTTKTTRRSTAGTTIPDDFALTEGMRNWARTKQLPFDIELETERFIYFWQAKSGKEAEKRNWEMAWRTWMLNDRYRTPAPAPQGHRGGPTAGYPDRNGVAVRDTQPRQSAGARKFTDAHRLAEQLDQEQQFATGGAR